MKTMFWIELYIAVVLLIFIGVMHEVIDGGWFCAAVIIAGFLYYRHNYFLPLTK